MQEFLVGLFCARGVPVHLRSGNTPEFISKWLRACPARLPVEPLFIPPGSPWENGYNEPFNGKLRDELRNREIFFAVQDARVLIECCRKEITSAGRAVRLGSSPGSTNLIPGALAQPGLT